MHAFVDDVQVVQHMSEEVHSRKLENRIGSNRASPPFLESCLEVHERQS